jgi:hypothetical protein
MHSEVLKKAAAPIAVLLIASPMLASCEALGGIAKKAGVPGADALEGCPELERGDLGKLKVDAKLKGFLEATVNFDKLAVDLEVGLIDSCAELGKALGLKDGQLKAKAGGGKGAEKVCGAVGAKLDAFMKANASANLAIEIGEPDCFADIEALTKCYADCGAAIKPGELKAACEGGEISGECSGTCQGSCTVEAGAQCKGSCSARCSGKCEADFSGTCGGTCKGKCDGKNTSGKCEGRCEGSCSAKAEGSCGGTCEGSCSGGCEVKGQADCKGSCEGGCSVDYNAPKCSGEFKPPSVSLDCQASCSAKSLASFSCEPPKVRVRVNGKSSAEIERVVAALEVALPKIAEIGLEKGKAIGKVGASLVSQVEGAVDGAMSAGAKAGVCLGFAAKMAASAAASVSANIDVSVKVSASASASAGGSAKAK